MFNVVSDVNSSEIKTFGQYTVVSVSDATTNPHTWRTKIYNVNKVFFSSGLKNSALDSLCSVEQPVEYLKTKETNCKTFVPNLTDVCNNNSSLSFKYYYGERGLFKVVQPIYNSIHKTEVKILYYMLITRFIILC